MPLTVLLHLPPDGGHTIKEYAVRLAPATQAAAGPEGSAPPATLVPPQYGAYFCSSSMLEPLKRYGINPKTRSRDGFAVKLQPLASCDQPAIADVLANSTLRGPQADTLLLVDIPSTRGSHTSPMASSALIMHLFLRFASTKPGSILPNPCGPILNAIAPPQLQHRPLTSPPLSPP